METPVNTPALVKGKRYVLRNANGGTFPVVFKNESKRWGGTLHFTAALDGSPLNFALDGSGRGSAAKGWNLANLSESEQNPAPVSPRDNRPVVAKGNATHIHVPGMAPIAARYCLARLSRLIPSHRPDTLERNPAYPYRNSRCYHSNKALQAQIHAHSQNLSAALLLDRGASALVGPPIVTQDGIVIGGNGRTIKMQRALANADGQFAFYADLIAGNILPLFGLQLPQRKYEPFAVVRVLDNGKPATCRALIPALNRSEANAATDFERALSIGEALPPGFLAKLEPAEGQTVRDLLKREGVVVYNRLESAGVFSPTERAELVEESDSRRSLTIHGAALMESAIVARLVNSADTLQSISANARDGLARIAAPLLRLQAATLDKRLPESYNLAAMLPAALHNAARMGGDRSDQGELFASEAPDLSREEQALAHLLRAGFAARASLGTATRELADEILGHCGKRDRGEQQLFERPPYNLAKEIMDRARALGSTATLPPPEPVSTDVQPEPEPVSNRWAWLDEIDVEAYRQPPPAKPSAAFQPIPRPLVSEDLLAVHSNAELRRVLMGGAPEPPVPPKPTPIPRKLANRSTAWVRIALLDKLDSNAADQLRALRKQARTLAAAWGALSEPARSAIANAADASREERRDANASGACRIEEGRQRVELFFPGKPSATLRGSLKEHGWRWFSPRKCWSSKGAAAPNQAREFAALFAEEAEQAAA